MTFVQIQNKSDEELLKQCRPKLEMLENIRLDKLVNYNFRKKIAVPSAAILTPLCGYLDYLLLMLQSSSDDSAAGITILVLGALWHWTTAPKRQYAKAYKKDILPDIAQLFGDFTYKHDGKISMERMKPSKIVPHHTIYKSEDYFSGSYKDIRIEFSEVKLQKKVGSGKSRRTETVFKGLVILLEIQHKRFYGHTILDKNQSKFNEWFKEKGTKLKRANLVDPEFEKLFDAYTNDQVEARYLIDPTMIEDLKALYMEYGGNKLAVALHDSNMLIMIASSHNHFEPADLHKTATSPESIINMKHEIEKILSIVDKLSLYDPVTLQVDRERNKLNKN